MTLQELKQKVRAYFNAKLTETELVAIEKSLDLAVTIGKVQAIKELKDSLTTKHEDTTTHQID